MMAKRTPVRQRPLHALTRPAHEVERCTACYWAGITPVHDPTHVTLRFEPLLLL